MRIRFAQVVLIAAALALGGAAALAQSSTDGSAPHPARPDGAIPVPSDRAADSYAIYSLLMPGNVFASMSSQQNARWAIAEVTVNFADRNPAVPPDGQLKPPPSNPKGFAEAVQDYNTNKNIRVLLTRDGFTLSHPFTLLTPVQVDEFRGARSGPTPSSESQTQWSGYPGITFFSEVYFDRKHRAALVYMNDWCAHLCAAGSWIYLEKHGGKWERRSGIVVPGG